MDRNTLPEPEELNRPIKRCTVYLAKEDGQTGGYLSWRPNWRYHLLGKPKANMPLPQDHLYNSTARNKVDRKRKETLKPQSFLGN